MSGIKRVFIGGVFYTAIAKYAGLGVSLVVAAILSRVLLPAEFGTVAVAMVLIAFFALVSDMGIGTAIIQKKELTEADLSQIFSLTMYLAAVAAGIFFVSSAVAAGYYGEPAMVRICKILSVYLFFSVANTVPNGLLLRDKEFRFVAVRTTGVQLVGGAMAVWAALRGWGIDSLLVAPVFSSAATFGINYWRYRIRFVWAVKWASVRKIFAYSIYQFLYTLINLNIENLLIGKYLGLTALGYYEKSYRLMLLPLSYFSNVLVSVIHPVFSDYQDRIRYITERYLKVVKLLATVGFPLSVGLFFSAKELILLLFGEQWGASVPVFRCLCVSMGFLIVHSSSTALFRTVNATKWMFIDGLLSTICTIGCLLVGLIYFQDLNRGALLISGSFVLNFFKTFYILFRQTLRQPLGLFYRQLIRPVIVGIVAAVLLYFIAPYAPEGLWGGLIVKVALSLAIVLPLIHVLGIYNMVSLVREGVRRALRRRR